jgi:hypothetical protein
MIISIIFDYIYMIEYQVIYHVYMILQESQVIKAKRCRAAKLEDRDCGAQLKSKGYRRPAAQNSALVIQPRDTFWLGARIFRYEKCVLATHRVARIV